MTCARSAPPFVHALLGFVAAALLWLAPAAGERHVPRGSVRARDVAHLAALDALRAPERVEPAPRAVPVTPARHGAGASPVVADALLAMRALARDATMSLSRTGAATSPRPRRLAFPTEATAPPRALS